MLSRFRQFVAAYLEQVGEVAYGKLRGVQTTGRASLAHDATRLAYSLVRIQARTGDPALLAAAQRWVDGALAGARRGALGVKKFEPYATEGSFFHGFAGVRFTRALVAHARGDVEGRAREVSAFASYATAPADPTTCTSARRVTSPARSPSTGRPAKRGRSTPPTPSFAGSRRPAVDDDRQAGRASPTRGSLTAAPASRTR